MVSVAIPGPHDSSVGSDDTRSASETGAMIVLWCRKYRPLVGLTFIQFEVLVGGISRHRKTIGLITEQVHIKMET